MAKERTTKISKRTKSENLWGWLFILPTMIGLIILNIIPIIQTIYQSFFKTGAFGKSSIFVGLANYEKLIGDNAVWKALLNTFVYMIIEVPLSIAIALVLAFLLNRKMRGRGVFRTLYFLPVIAAPAAIAMVWRWLYNTEFGLINYLLGRVGLAPISWISDSKVAIISLGIVGIWSVVGYNIVLFLSGLQEIPSDYYEAASIDGANGVKQFFNITLPLISPTMFFVSVIRVIAALQMFDLVYMMIDRGNPALPHTQTLVYLFYKYSFEEGNKGYASTIIVILLLIIVGITALQNYAQKKWVTYN